MSAPPTAATESLLPTGPRSPLSELLSDVRDLMKLAAPMFLGACSFSIMKTTDSALLGHSGTNYLTAVTLSELWTSSIGVFAQSRCLSTLAGQAYGAGNYKLVGIYMQVAFVVLGTVGCLVTVGRMFTGDILLLVGKTSEMEHEAQYFVNVMTLCMPGRIMCGQLLTFFASQKIMKPSSYAAILAMLANLILGLIFVLGIPPKGFSAAGQQIFEGYGFKACPWVTVFVETMQIIGIWLIACVHFKMHAQCWNGCQPSEITRERIWTYLELYFPSTLSVSSDFWRVTALGAIASSTGDINVAVWNTSYRICWLALIFIGSLAGAMGIRLNIALGSGDVSPVRRVITAAFATVIAVIAVLVAVIVLIPRQIGMLFSDDPEVLDLFEESRFGLAAFVGLMNFAVFVERIPGVVGRPDLNLKLGLIGSWLGQVPGAYLCTKYWRNDLVGLYAGSAFGYGLLSVLLALACLSFDWTKLAQEARRRAEVPSLPPPQGSGNQVQPSDAESAGKTEADDVKAAVRSS